jgi:hypothetical protein
MMSSCCRTFYIFESFPLFWCLDTKGGEDSYLYQFFIPSSVLCMVLSCTDVGHMDKNLFMLACKTFMEI